jgi:tetratricopeptide (TPR) repeat protein
LNPRAWIALSYAQQASFKLEDALHSAERAAELNSQSSTAHARVAELMMSLGRVRTAERAAKAAVDANANESRAHTILGFVHLAQIDTKKAREDFLSAIERDSSDPLARLGVGLAIIRDGDLKAGREQIEIAVALDPNNSLIRSYVGKAYYEENTTRRNQLAASQFSKAEQLDPNDPTPWFYAAILKDSETRPAEAVEDLRRSAQLNDNRAVYRSQLLVDQDTAARNTSQGSIYNELGFSQLGLAEASSSLAIDPSSASTHRFLADIYATLPRYGIARASELLQAQLRQPLGASPLQPQLANDVLFNNTLFGPATVGMNEFNPLFLRNRLELQLFGLVGTDNTYGEQVVVNGLQGPLSFSLSQFLASTDGYRANNDNSPRQYDAFVQAQLAYETSIQFEATKAQRTFGDLASNFNPAAFDRLQRNSDDVDTHRFGLRQILDAESDILVSVIHQSSDTVFVSNDPIFPTTLDVKQESWKSEAQYLRRIGGIDAIVGASYFDGWSDETLTIMPFPPDKSEFHPHHLNGYVYMYTPRHAGLPQFQIGVSYDDLSSAVGDQNTLNPKLGLIWRITDSTTLRAAGFRVLKRQISSDQGLEPTQIAGFNQFFDDANGTVSDVGGVAADFVASPTTTVGVQYTHRSLSVPYFIDINNVFFQRQTEESVGAYAYWLPSKRVSISFQPQYQHFTGGALFDEMELLELPFALRVFLPAGLWVGTSVTGVGQRNRLGDFKDSDTYWLVDAVVAYRLPQRMGTVSLQGTNLTNQRFKFQEIDAGVLPRYIPQSRLFLRVSLNF